MGVTRMAGRCQFAFVVGLFLLLLPLSILDEESRESTPALPAMEEDDIKEMHYAVVRRRAVTTEVDIPFTSSLGLFEENILWKGFINTQPIDKPILNVPPMEKKLDIDSNEKESGEYRGVVYTINGNP